jgi:hypothetical protein
VRDPDWTIIDIALSDRPAAVRGLVNYFFRPVDVRRPISGFSGGLFDGFPHEQCFDEVNVITTADVVAVSMLSVNIPPRVAYHLTVERPEELSRALRVIEPLATLKDQQEDSSNLQSARAAWSYLDGLPDMGATKTAKLLARKRPRLVPIQDSVVMEALGKPTRLWEPLRIKLRSGLDDVLAELHNDAMISSDVSHLRVLDVLVWTRFQGYW